MAQRCWLVTLDLDGERFVRGDAVPDRWNDNRLLRLLAESRLLRLDQLVGWRRVDAGDDAGP